MTMIKSGLLLTAYVVASGYLFLKSLMEFSNTIPTALMYGLFLLPLYICVLSICWMQILRSSTWKIPQLKRWIVLLSIMIAIFIFQHYAIIVLLCFARVKLQPKWTQPIPFRPWIWTMILPLQLAIMVVSPGNCYGWKQGKVCYSNIQLWVEHLPRDTTLNVPYWVIGDGVFVGIFLIMIYAALLFFAVRRRSMKNEKLIH